LRAIADLERPTSGELLVNGVSPHEARLKRDYGYVFQAPALYPWRSIERNVTLPLEIMGVPRAERRARARQYLDLVNLGGFARKFPWQLSGGMQQRTSLCRALIHEPDLLMLDEPFGALDAFTREELWCVIRDLHAARGITVVLVTHDVREAVFLADRIFVMSHRPGRIVVEHKVEFPRPRDLEITYTKEFADIVLELRGHIGALRTPVNQ
jgi:NitT/TauT family transport system ATP-binding protein